MSTAYTGRPEAAAAADERPARFASPRAASTPTLLAFGAGDG
ncbi:MAG TPA: hypothetical protein VFS43_25745 [Polyangiaceae bacterium]|nr:hypothetical protein [Polyangiaceae bacterium]